MSNSELMLDVGQANELKLAFRRAVYTNDEIKQLCEGSLLADVRGVLRGFAEIKANEYVINCDADPFLPEGWRVEEHQKGGMLKWDPLAQEKKQYLYLSKLQWRDKTIGWDDLRKDLEGKPVLNANVLDYLRAHIELIPEEWKSGISFWGTIYRDPGGCLGVRFLYRSVGIWRWGVHGFSHDFGYTDPAALRAQPTP